MLELILGHPGVALDRQSQYALPAPDPANSDLGEFCAEECVFPMCEIGL